MGKYCCIRSCKNTYFKPTHERIIENVKFYIFPAHMNNPKKPWLQTKRIRWINAVKHYGKHPDDWKPPKYAYICSAHFIGNEKSEDPSHESYLPTIFDIVANPKHESPTSITGVMNEEVSKEECRSCLRIIEEDASQELFRAWFTPWAMPGAMIADDLAKLAEIEISESDEYSKVICLDCYNSLADACSFLINVRRSDDILKKRCAGTTTSTCKATDIDTSLWPKPILLNKSINGCIENSIEVEIKQEVLSEDEYTSSYMDQDFDPQMDIKIEPEEIAPAQTGIKVNGAYSLKDLNKEGIHMNGSSNYFEEYLENTMDSTIKQEPMSGDEQESIPDLPLDCLLCMNSFQSVNALKAHVISQHSYGAVKRKTDSTEPSMKKEVKNEFVCSTCRQSFRTRTDLTVHSASHSAHVCFVCDSKFDTFLQLLRHGTRCRRDRPPPRAAAAPGAPPRPPRLSRPKPGSTPEDEKAQKEKGPKVEPVNRPKSKKKTKKQKLEPLLTPKIESVNDKLTPTLPTQDEPVVIDNSSQNVLVKDEHCKTEDVSPPNDQDTIKSPIRPPGNEPEYILSTNEIKNETCYIDIDLGHSILQEGDAHSNVSKRENIPDADDNCKKESSVLITEETKQNMEIHLAINPLNDGELILPDKIEDMENVNSNLFQPKLLDNSSGMCDDATQ